MCEQEKNTRAGSDDQVALSAFMIELCLNERGDDMSSLERVEER
jgi:hypothetical protein